MLLLIHLLQEGAGTPGSQPLQTTPAALALQTVEPQRPLYSNHGARSLRMVLCFPAGTEAVSYLMLLQALAKEGGYDPFS